MRTLTPEFLLELFEFDAEKGLLTWKHRPLSHFDNWKSWQSWTIHAAGLPAGNCRADGYIRIAIDKKRYYAHRIIYAISRGINYEDVPPIIDHIDYNHRNNRADNLRPATKSQNMMNAGIRTDNRTGFKGVGWDKRFGAYSARIRVDGKQRMLGHFDTPEEASRVREAAANDMHGEFARHATRFGVAA